MAKNLVVVESPAKMKTIKKFLGSNYTVEASMGHIRDLPKSTMGVNIENNFEPKYINIRGKGELISKLKKEAAQADKVYLATDPDREGEAISWHLRTAMGLDNSDKVYRITFNEITKKAVTNAIMNPRQINMDLVNAQQGRRVVDRVVGYSISPILWQKIKRGLSAGRVQSVALRMICDRDAEITAFVPEEYHTVEAVIKKGSKTVKAQYYGENGEKVKLRTADEAMAVVNDVTGALVRVSDITESERVRNAPWPFTTSTMQQEASRALNLSTQQTMRIAQKLYEEGLITYLRTDSVRISDEAAAAARGYIAANYGDKYVSHRGAGSSRGQGNVQDAHEAIRPADINRTPVIMKEKLGRDEFRLYQLIWKRFTASRMSAAVYAQTKAVMDCGTHTFTAAGSKLKFDGFLSVYKPDGKDDENKQDLGILKAGENIVFNKVEDIQHFTEPPAHYTEASLVKALEEDGIGRPSTYAPTITTLLARNYITREKKNLYSTELGIAVNDLMVRAFPNIVDTGFTAGMEAELDKIAEGKKDWRELLNEFYPDFEKSLNSARDNIGRVKVADQVTDVICEKCGRNMVIKYGPYGKFLGCPGFPECRNTKPLLERIGVKCPDCGGEVVKKRSKKGRIYYGCENPECKFYSYRKPGKGKAASAARSVKKAAAEDGSVPDAAQMSLVPAAVTAQGEGFAGAVCPDGPAGAVYSSGADDAVYPAGPGDADAMNSAYGASAVVFEAPGNAAGIPDEDMPTGYSCVDEAAAEQALRALREQGQEADMGLDIGLPETMGA